MLKSCVGPFSIWVHVVDPDHLGSSNSDHVLSIVLIDHNCNYEPTMVSDSVKLAPIDEARRNSALIQQSSGRSPERGCGAPDANRNLASPRDPFTYKRSARLAAYSSSPTFLGTFSTTRKLSTRQAPWITVNNSPRCLTSCAATLLSTGSKWHLGLTQSSAVLILLRMHSLVLVTDLSVLRTHQQHLRMAMAQRYQDSVRFLITPRLHCRSIPGPTISRQVTNQHHLGTLTSRLAVLCALQGSLEAARTHSICLSRWRRLLRSRRRRVGVTAAPGLCILVSYLRD